MKIIFTLITIISFICSYGQGTSSDKKPRWQLQAGSGLFLDLFYANIYIGDYGNVEPLYYSDKKGTRVKPGKIDRLEIRYRLGKYRSAFSLNIQNALFKDILGSGNDPLEQWKNTKRYKQRLQFSANYYKIFPIRKRSEIQTGLGFLVSGEKNDFPAYRYENNSISFIESDKDFFWDPGLAINAHYFYKINKTLHVGATFYTYYLHQIGFEGVALQGSIGINF